MLRAGAAECLLEAFGTNARLQATRTVRSLTKPASHAHVQLAGTSVPWPLQLAGGTTMLLQFICCCVVVAAMVNWWSSERAARRRQDLNNAPLSATDHRAPSQSCIFCGSMSVLKA